jgi:hypothetical protein
MGVVALASIACRWPVVLAIAAPLLAWLVSIRLGMTWNRALSLRLGLVLGALYAPFVVPASLVTCSHCREAWLTLFAVAPGVVPTHLGLRLLGYGRLSDDFEFTIAALATLGLVVLLFLIARSGRARLAAVVLVALLWSSASAYVLEAAIRA